MLLSNLRYMSSSFIVTHTCWVPQGSLRSNDSITGTFSSSWRMQHTENDERKKQIPSVGLGFYLHTPYILAWNIYTYIWSLPPLQIECENTTLYLTFFKISGKFIHHILMVYMLELLESFWRYSLTPIPFSGFDIICPLLDITKKTRLKRPSFYPLVN